MCATYSSPPSLANQEVLRWQIAMQKEIGDNITDDAIRAYLWKTLKSGQVVPGYGHGVLRSPDPRFIALQHFCEARPELENSPMIRLVKKVRVYLCELKCLVFRWIGTDIGSGT